MIHMKAVKFKIPRPLLARMDALVEALKTSRSAFVQEAIENELQRQEAEQTREEIALQEIRKNILAEGHAVDVMNDGDPASHHDPHCEMCMKPLPPPSSPVDGPLFCKQCLELARGPKMPETGAGP